ncbi:flagellar hook-length control protein FliK [Enterobacteriaceae bacterium RIT691]|nr:flagellar hook-length control protein FliK [Enterobacteriaceae bacterium RIT691]
MITLPKLIVSDNDITSAAQSAKNTDSAGSAQDFFALLSGAMSGKAGKGGKAGITLADLQAASQKLPQGDAKTALNKLLAQQDTDALQKTGPATLTDAQSVLNALTPEAKSDVLKQLSKDLQKSDDKPSADNEEMAGLSALMAMLPHNANAATTVPMTERSATAAANSKTGSDALSGVGNTAVETKAQGKALGKNATLLAAHSQQAAATDDLASNQTTPFAAAVAAKHASDSTLSAASAVPTAPVISNATATVNTHPVVTVNSQLGTPEWQQNVSQHITLFTRQGQQTAELKLHPEDLGQVNITLKLDDNQAQIQMVSPHSHVRAALEAAIPTLRTQLADNGIQLAQSNVSSDGFAGQQQQSAFGQSSSQSSAEGRAFAADEEETLSVPATLQAQARGNGIVDIFA